MAEPSTFIKVDRNILDWRWYQDGNTLRVFLHLLLKANIKDKDFEKITIHRGEIATSYPSLALALGLSVQNVRTAIRHLKETGEVTVKSYTKFSVISIKNYNLYQSSNSQLTGNQQATNSHLTGNQQQSKNVRIEECKNERNNNGESDKPTPSPTSKKPKEIRHKYGEYQHVKLTDSEYQRLVADFGENLIRNYIQRVDEYCQQYGKSYKDYNLTIRKWLKKDNRGAMNGNGSNIWNAGII